MTASGARRALLVALIVVSLGSYRAEAAEKPPDDSVNFAVPDSPAFTYLETTPTQISRPGTARDLAVAVLSGVNRAGQMSEGLAIDVRPWFLIPGFSIPLDKYRQTLYYILANAQVSLGTVQAGAAPMTGAAGDVDAAFGLRLSIIDRGDPMLSKDYTNALGKLMIACAPASPDEPEEKSLTCMHDKVNPLRAAWLDSHWNASRLSLGFATGLRAPGSLIEDSTWRGLAAWGVGGIGLGGWGQLIGQLRYDRDHLLKTNDFRFGARANVGTATFNGFVEVIGRARPGAADGIDKFDANWSAGAEVRLAEHTWLSAGFGKSFATDQQADPIIVLASIKWAVANDSRISLH